MTDETKAKLKEIADHLIDYERSSKACEQWQGPSIRKVASYGWRILAAVQSDDQRERLHPPIRQLVENPEGMGLRCPACGQAWIWRLKGERCQCSCMGEGSLMRPVEVQRGYYSALFQAQELFIREIEDRRE